MSNSILSILRDSAIFSALDNASIKKLLPKFKEVTLKKNEFLFLQGDESNGFYILISGKLIIILKEKQLERIIGDIDPGETVGEMGAIVNGPRSASVQATEDSVVLHLTSKDFLEICNDYPSVIVQVMNKLALRSRSLIEMLSQTKRVKQHVVILPACTNTPIEEFANLLHEHTSDEEDVVILSDYDEKLYQQFKTQKEILQHTLDLQKKQKIIFYILNMHDSKLAQVAFENSDVLYVVANGDSTPQINNFAMHKIKSKDLIYKAKPELILLHKLDKRLPSHTKKWLKLASFGMHHHIRLNREADLEKIVRFLTGRAIGLVLGGGGVRSWAHIGVIKALTESNIPIDVIGATSAGAIVGGYYSLYETWEDSRQDLHALSTATNKTLCFYNLTWPAVSIFDGKGYTIKQKKVFGNARTENLWRSFFCVSCNLAKSSAVMQKTGLLWKHVRSSTSVPGVFPPVVIKGEIHLDGGLVNNLPVDMMQKLSSNIGTIIAVELIHHVVDDKGYNFPPILPFWKVVLSKLGLAFREYRFPHFVDTFLKSLLVGSSIKQKENSLSADILIHPDLTKFHLLSISKKQESELIEIGYQETLKVLKKCNWIKNGKKAKSKKTKI